MSRRNLLVMRQVEACSRTFKQPPFQSNKYIGPIRHGGQKGEGTLKAEWDTGYRACKGHYGRP